MDERLRNREWIWICTKEHLNSTSERARKNQRQAASQPDRDRAFSIGWKNLESGNQHLAFTIEHLTFSWIYNRNIEQWNIQHNHQHSTTLSNSQQAADYLLYAATKLSSTHVCLLKLVQPILLMLILFCSDFCPYSHSDAAASSCHKLQ